MFKSNGDQAAQYDTISTYVSTLLTYHHLKNNSTQLLAQQVWYNASRYLPKVPHTKYMML